MKEDHTTNGHNTSITRMRMRVLLLLLFVVPLGFATKFYTDGGHLWVNNYLGGFFYEIFWILVAFFIFPRSKPFHIAFIVFLATCALEFLQLWHPPFLEWARSYFIGRTVLGNYFTWYDFPWYILGSLAGFVIINSRFFRHI